MIETIRRWRAPALLACLIALFTSGADAQQSRTFRASWDTVSGSNVAGYCLYHGILPRSQQGYDDRQCIGQVTSYNWTLPVQTGTDYFAITTRATDGTESALSPEVRVTTVLVSDADGDGINDGDDNCPNSANSGQTNTDGDAQGDACDSDDDNDSVADGSDNCRLVSNQNQANNDADAEGDACDGDDDNDSIADGSDNCRLISNQGQGNNDGDAQGDACDSDDDNDSIADGSDNCRLISNQGQGNNDGDARGDACDGDDDNDSIADGSDNCRLISNQNQADNDGDAQGDACDSDDDNDSVADATDNCPADPNTDQADGDGDGQGDACDGDSDGDGVADGSDNCPNNPNQNQANNDDDAQGDACDADDDNDGVADSTDNCRLVSNQGQANNDDDDQGDACDADDDNDQVADATDNCPANPNTDQADGDGDGQGDACDGDSDGDGIADADDNCPDSPNGLQTDTDGDGEGNACDADDDNDGIADGGDNCRIQSNPGQADLDADGDGNACDADDDGDEIADGADNCPLSSNADQADSDDDGTGNACDDVDGLLCEAVRDINPETAMGSMLASDDCSMEALLESAGSGYVDQFRLTLPASGRLSVSMDSSEIDTRLLVMNEDLSQTIDTDVDGGPGANAALIEDLPAGTYVILATTNAADQTGLYSLSTRFTSDATERERTALAASTLPSGRAVGLGDPATAFVSLTNFGQSAVTDCALSPLTTVPADFLYQTTNPETNALVGTPNSRIDIAPDETQTFVIAFTPNGAFEPTDIRLGLDCANASPAPVIPGLNTLLLSASAEELPDIIAISATVSGDGIVSVPQPGASAFVVATANVGASGMITAEADTGSVTLPILLEICETDPQTSACTNPTQAKEGTVRTEIGPGEVPTFAVFITATEAIPFEPAANRVFVRFRRENGTILGITSIAVTTD